MRKHLYFLALLAVPWIGACSEPLEVKNVNNPNRDDVLAQPADLENWIRDSYNAWWRGVFNGQNVQPQMRVMALENHSELANYNQGPRYLIPRNFIENTRGAAGAGEISTGFDRFSNASRSAALGLSKLNDVTLGSADADARGRAFAWFTLGLSLGYLSIPFDSAAIAWPTDDPACTALDCLPQLIGYAEVNAKAVEALDSAAAIAAGSVAFTIPSSWMRQGATVSQANFLRLIRSYRAVIRIAAARTPAERAAVDWTSVIADANNGITADFETDAEPATGWSISWPADNFRAGSWHAMHQFMIGGADTTGTFLAWLNTPRAGRVQFLMQTPDTRFPTGDTRAAQQTGQVALPPGQYYRNRPAAEDTPADPLGNSMYDHYRFYAFNAAGRVGPFPILTKAEVDLIAAEGYLRANDFTNAMVKINPTRTAAGLPALAGITSLNDPVPGGTACVPRVPTWTGSAYTLPCGNIWDAMKWEKRLETQYTNFANWFMDSRGWGDLPEGTPVHFVVPWQEKDTRRADFITAFGGCGKLGTGESTGSSTYGPIISCSPI
ncbi:MAG: RagB/SusD family nutrient uptake outer membrane protein [Gemmatimonadota bacterium]|nr:RagB/SusD family nutrient uptake outer membrane protein [Gemmatimonadota bacterium]MDH3367583.1 RagB/SusD family nutrient uptake outer membrane protein [Gemmatimonadota bacterium]MDH3477413.1 RagB/SusD family nutrient uptake outer membrane protein [Gemmatimonadota bacterium]MDH3569306.1 RagB/SusD family nutrient uptake outer membrane protein [Gemmatimonadota bacterium]MDH5550708.1 RagB/SusD family nutrient uptake outer membrane protein [Gemmatimonadota bacterium]